MCGQILQRHGHIGGTGCGGEACGVREQRLGRSHFSSVGGPSNYALDKQAGMFDIEGNNGARKCQSILPIQSLMMKPLLGSILKTSAGRTVLFARTAA
jgi:hypothetical protein